MRSLIVSVLSMSLITMGMCSNTANELAVLEQMLQTVQSKISSQQDVIDYLNQKIEEMEQSENVLQDALTVDQRATTQPVVAFFSSRETNVSHLTVQQTLVFDSVKVNVHNGYNKATGVFTCPVTGLYEFACTIVSAGEQHNLNLVMMKEQTEVTYLHATLYEYDMGTQVAVTQCTKGERVWIRQVKASPHGLPEGFSTFSGHLIHMY